MTESNAQMSSIKLTWKEDPSAGPIPAYIYHPAISQQNPLPIALIFHAGGFVLGTANMVPKNQIRYLVEKGFVVVTPEYRLCPQVSLQDGPVQDAKDLLRWCQTELPKTLQESNIAVDPTRIVAMGHSAGGMLALTTGLCPNPSLAIVDFYGCIGLSSPFWRKPLAAFAQIPDQPEEHIQKIFEGPQAITSPPLFVDGKPVLSDPRCAWYIQQLKQGTSISSLVPDGDYARVDPAAQFSEKFPPAYFLHGKSDVFAPWEVSVKAHEELKRNGVETEIVLGEDIGHVFDFEVKEGDERWVKYVVPALEWMVRHV